MFGSSGPHVLSSLRVGRAGQAEVLTSSVGNLSSRLLQLLWAGSVSQSGLVALFAALTRSGRRGGPPDSSSTLSPVPQIMTLIAILATASTQLCYLSTSLQPNVSTCRNCRNLSSCPEFSSGVSFCFPVHRKRGKIEGYSCVGGTCSSVRAHNGGLICLSCRNLSQLPQLKFCVLNSTLVYPPIFPYIVSAEK